jgi:hypothetical protein
VHFGVILPKYGKEANPDAIRRVAEAAEELGFDSVWATEHIIVGPEGVDPYGRVYDPLVTLGWIAGWTERVPKEPSCSSWMKPRCATSPPVIGSARRAASA